MKHLFRVGILMASILAFAMLAACTEDILDPDEGRTLSPLTDVEELGTTSNALPPGLQDRIANDELAITANADRFHAVNRLQGLRVWFEADGTVRVEDRSNPDSGVWLRFSGLGRRGDRSPVSLSERGYGPCLDVTRLTTANQCLTPLEHRRDGVVEWFDNRPEGVEQGFDLAIRPPGDGPLVLEVAVEGGEAVGQGDSLVLWSRGVEVARYGGLVVRDAGGLERAGQLRSRGSAIELVIDDRGLAYPLVIDPLITTPVATLESNQADAYFGLAISSAGDVNGDGYADILIGAPYYANGQLNEGRFYIYLGSADGIAIDAPPAATFESNKVLGELGSSVSSAGDVNGDGYADILVGAPGFENGEEREGRVFLYLGSADGITSGATPAATLESNQATSRFGYSVSSAGDVNGDGYADILVGAPAQVSQEEEGCSQIRGPALRGVLGGILLLAWAGLFLLVVGWRRRRC